MEEDKRPFMLSAKMRAYLVVRKYGWATALLILVPFAADQVFFALLRLSPEVQFWQPDGGLTVSLVQQWRYLGQAVLLGALYVVWTRQMSDTVRLVWQYMIVLGTANAVKFGILYLLIEWTGMSYGYLGHFLIASFSSLPIVLWLARRASRFSLAHAYFMVYIAWGLHLPWLFGELQIEWTLLYLLWGYLSAVFSVWLLSNFGGFSPKIQRNIAIALIALAGLGYVPLVAHLGELPLELLYVSPFVLRVVLIYAVRVRQG